MFFFLLWNLSLMYEFSLLHQVPLVTIGLHRCALVTNYSGEAEEGEAQCNRTLWSLKRKHKFLISGYSNQNTTYVLEVPCFEGH